MLNLSLFSFEKLSPHASSQHAEAETWKGAALSPSTPRDAGRRFELKCEHLEAERRCHVISIMYGMCPLRNRGVKS